MSDRRLDHGWMTDEGYICDGCSVRAPHEHRCHGSDGGPACECAACVEPSDEELAAFLRAEGLA